MPEPPIITIDIEALKDITCTGCGGKYFQAVYSIKLIPRFSVPGLTEDALKIIPADKCASCGLIRTELNSNQNIKP